MDFVPVMLSMEWSLDTDAKQMEAGEWYGILYFFKSQQLMV